MGTLLASWIGWFNSQKCVRNRFAAAHHLPRMPVGRKVARRGERKASIMKQKALLFALAILTVNTAVAQEAKVTQLMSKDLKDPGREGLMIVVDYPPGSSDPIHRHNANAFVYVLEGS